MYTLIKPYKVGNIEFAVGTKFAYDGSYLGFYFLSYCDEYVRYSGRLRVSDDEFREYFRRCSAAVSW